MRLIIPDTFLNAPFTIPLANEWLTVGETTVETPLTLDPAQLGALDSALVPAGAVGLLPETHEIAYSTALVFDTSGPIAMRVPVRPDEIERTPIALHDTSPTGEVLANALLHPFFGISAERWTEEPDADAQVAIVEGAEALRSAAAGYQEDLVRAWFVLTGVPLVHSVLAIPRGQAPDRLARLLGDARALSEGAATHRRGIRRALSEGFDLPADSVQHHLTTTRYALEPGDRNALLALLHRGTSGSRYPRPESPPFAEAHSADPSRDQPYDNE